MSDHDIVSKYLVQYCISNSTSIQTINLATLDLFNNLLSVSIVDKSIEDINFSNKTNKPVQNLIYMQFAIYLTLSIFMH